jgi:1,4-dihydroxy-2-naphthoate octaprenyltransferase
VDVQVLGVALIVGAYVALALSVIAEIVPEWTLLSVLSLPLLQGSERPWTWREPLRPNSAPRPPNERPG